MQDTDSADRHVQTSDGKWWRVNNFCIDSAKTVQWTIKVWMDMLFQNAKAV